MGVSLVTRLGRGPAGLTHGWQTDGDGWMTYPKGVP